MNNNRIREIISAVRDLAVEYNNLTGKPLGVTGEIAEVAAADALGLELAEARTAGYDAICNKDGSLKRIQIKGRAHNENSKPGAKLGTLSQSGECDTIMMVLLDKDTLLLREIWEAKYEDIDAALLKPGSKARNERRQISVGSFKKKAKRIWPI